MLEREDSDSDAPEEFTSEQGTKQEEEIRKVKKDNKARIVREVKGRRRLWARRNTPRPSKGGKSVHDDKDPESDMNSDSPVTAGMLPDNIVQQLAAREKKVFLSDSEDENPEAKPTPRKNKLRSSGVETVILNDMSVPQCLHNSLEFLKKKKRRVQRSSSVLNNSNQALRLISTSGLLSNK